MFSKEHETALTMLGIDDPKNLPIGLVEEIDKLKAVFATYRAHKPLCPDVVALLCVPYTQQVAQEQEARIAEDKKAMEPPPAPKPRAKKTTAKKEADA